MEITVTELEPCKLAIKYTADNSEIDSKKSEVLKAFKKAPVSGFRKNKAPMNAIKIHYKKQIEESLKRALAESSYHSTIFEKKLRPYGTPNFKSVLLNGNAFTCEFDLSIKPDFELPDFRAFEIPKPHETINVTDLSEKMMQDLRVRFGEVSPYSETDFVQTGDNVIIDYEGTIDGQKIDNLSVQGEMVTVGKSQFTEFDSNILGMNLGETREFDVIIPTGGLPSLSGKTAHFKVTLNNGSKTVPCPLDDSLAKSVGKNTITEVKEFINLAAQGKVSAASRTQLLDSVATKLVEDTSINVPNWLNLAEAQYLAASAKLDWNLVQDIDKEKYMELASKNIKLSLILDRIRENEPEAQLSDQEMLSIIKQNIAQSKTTTSVEDVLKQLEQSGRLNVIVSKLLDEHALDFVTKSVKIIE